MASSSGSAAGLARTYLKVFGALMGLTVLTVAASYVHLLFPVAVAVGVALVIAAFKGSLVAAFFMHLIGEQRLIVGILLLCGFFLAALLLLPIVGVKDQFGTPGPAVGSPSLHKEP